MKLTLLLDACQQANAFSCSLYEHLVRVTEVGRRAAAAIASELFGIKQV